MTDEIAAQIPGSGDQPIGLNLHIPDGRGHPIVFICHGFKGFKDWGFFADLARRMVANGIAAVRLNFSHNGVGLGNDASEFTRLDLFERDRMSYRLADLQSVFRAVKELRIAGAERVDTGRAAVLGHSLGGSVALLSQESIPFRALVTLASVKRTGFSPEQEEVLEREGRVVVVNTRTGQDMPIGLSALEDLRSDPERFDMDRAARELRIPWLVVHGDQDASVPVDAAHHLAAVAPPELVELEIVEGADHVMNVKHPFESPSPAYEHFADRAIEFLKRAFR